MYGFRWRRVYTVVLVVLAILLVVIGISNYNTKVREPNVISIMNKDGIVVNLVESKLPEEVVVKGANNEFVSSYFNGLGVEGVGNKEFTITYIKPLNVQEMNDILSAIESKESKVIINKAVLKDYTTIYKVLQNSDNTMENLKIINKLITSGDGSDLTYMSIPAVTNAVSKTTIKGSGLKELTDAVQDLRQNYLNGFNATPV